MKIVGICGKSGSGKTTVGKMICEKYPAYIDCDMVSRNVTNVGSPCLKELENYFGKEIIMSDGSLNRGKLASIVFSDRCKISILNDITHKYILDSVLKTIENYRAIGEKVVFVDAPTLFESGLNEKCDYIIGVFANEEFLIKRIVDRDSKTVEEAQKRLSAQYEDEYIRSRCNLCIENNGTLTELKDKVDKALKRIEEIL